MPGKWSLRNEPQSLRLTREEYRKRSLEEGLYSRVLGEEETHFQDKPLKARVRIYGEVQKEIITCSKRMDGYF